MDVTKIISWLPFDESATQDLIGGTWTVSGTTPAIVDADVVSGKALNLTGKGYIYTTPPELGTNDFTVHWWENIPSSQNSFTREVVAIDGTTGTHKHCFDVSFFEKNVPCIYLGNNNNQWIVSEVQIGTKIRDQWIHRAVVRCNNIIYVFEGGKLYTSFAFTASLNVSGSSLFVGGFARASRNFIGMLAEFQFLVGTALWTANFTPPTANDYNAIKLDLGLRSQFKYTYDVQTATNVEVWRYENAGIADGLLTESTTITPLYEPQSTTGTAFYQTARGKSFDIPASYELWIKFDVFFDGATRWRAYNEPSDRDVSYSCGITAQTALNISVFANGTNVAPSDTALNNLCIKNQLQTVLLHMVSDSAEGVIEFWIDGRKAYKYVGDVNGGDTFGDFYLQSDGAGTFFSNIIISNADVTLTDNTPEHGSAKNIYKSVVCWLPFDESLTEDYRGNKWTTSGTMEIGERGIIFSGGQYVQTNDKISLGGRDFTIRCKIFLDSSTSEYARVFEIKDTVSGWRINLRFEYLGQSCYYYLDVVTDTSIGPRGFSNPKGQTVNVEITYQHGTGTWRAFYNGSLYNTVTHLLPRTTFNVIRIGRGITNTTPITGSVRDFIIFDGVALHTAAFNEANDQTWWENSFAIDRKLNFGVETATNVEIWRYRNMGTADDLLITGTTLTNLPTHQSTTGTAFYQTARAKCFDIPASYELWIKFDVYNTSTAWRAYNEGANGYLGVQGNGTTIIFYSNGNAWSYSAANALATNTLQTVLVHLKSGETAGVIEAWVDSKKIYTYTGDVNHGQIFSDFYLQSAGAATFFSGVIISNGEIGFDEICQKISFDLESQIANFTPWIYKNPGEAELLATEGATTVEVPYTQSVTGKAFYGSNQLSDMFHTPAGLKEIWIRFDAVHFPQNAAGGNFYVGHWSTNQNRILGMRRSDDAFQDHTAIKLINTDVAHVQSGQFNEYLLHIKSDATNGLIELTIDKDTYTTTGNINDGKDLDNIIFYATSSRTIYSNVVISSDELFMGSGVNRDSFGVETKINAPVLNVRLQGSNVKFPLSTKRKSNSLTIRVGDKNFYNTSVAESSSLAGAARYLLDDKARALSTSVT